MERENQKRSFAEKALRAGPYLFIVAAAAIVYSNSLHVPFLFDDRLNILDNPYIRITRLSEKQLTRAAIQDGFQMRLLSNLTFGLDYYFNGLSKTWMHIENIAIHALNAVLVYAIVLAVIPLAGFPGSGPGRRRAAALMAALLWSVHPAHTQAVTYLVQRHTLMAACGSLASFFFYLKARSDGPAGRRLAFFALSILCFTAGALSKETGFVAPAYIVLFEMLVMRKARTRELMSGCAVLVAAAGLMVAAWAVVTFLIRSGILAAYFSSYLDMDYGPAERLLTESRIVLSYFLTMVFPHPCRLALDHQVSISSDIIAPWTSLPAVMLVGGSVIAAFVLRKRTPVAAFLVLSFIASLAPESSVIPVALMQDHRIYIYSMFVLPPVVAWTVMKVDMKKSLPLIAAAVLMCMAVSYSRNLVWSSEDALWADSVNKSPGLFRPWSNLCAARLDEGHYDEAARYCQTAVRLGPDHATPAVNRAVAMYHLGRKEEAGEAFRRAAEKWPDDALALYNYGSFLESEKQYDKAIELYGRTLEADVFHFQARLSRAELYERTGRRKKAKEEFETLMRLFPGRAAEIKDSAAYH